MSRRSFHSTTLVGWLAAAPETKYTQNNGTAVTRFKVLVNEEWKDAAGNEQKHVESYIIVSFNGLAEACGNHLSTGSRILVRGRNRTRSYEKDGGKRYVTELIADTVLSLEAPKEGQRSTPGQPEPSQISSDEIGF